MWVMNGQQLARSLVENIMIISSHSLESIRFQTAIEIVFSVYIVSLSSFFPDSLEIAWERTNSEGNRFPPMSTLQV